MNDLNVTISSSNAIVLKPTFSFIADQVFSCILLLLVQVVLLAALKSES